MIPLERDEQIAFVEWLEFKKIKFSAISQSTYTKSWKQRVGNKKLGQRKGLPDMIIYLSEKQTKNKNIVLFVEMKRIKGGVTSPEQKEWIRCLNTVDNIQAQVCKGSKEAINFINNFI